LDAAAQCTIFLAARLDYAIIAVLSCVCKGNRIGQGI
jgi:hypothetical protein